MEGALKFLLAVGAYILGSVPAGIIAARVFGAPDPRTAGSKNMGATNVRRVAGNPAGALTLVGDILKGTAPTALALYWTHDALFVSIVGFLAFSGHLFPVFLGLRGGKGVATACGVLLAISPLTVLLSAVVFSAFLFATRYVSVGSIMAALSLPVFVWLFKDAYLPLSISITVLVIIKHSDNIKRLVRGEENRFKA